MLASDVTPHLPQGPPPVHLLRVLSQGLPHFSRTHAHESHPPLLRLFPCPLGLENADGVVGQPIACQGDSFLAGFVDEVGVLAVEFVGGEDVGVGGVLGNPEGLLGPNCRIDDLAQLLHFLPVLAHQGSRHCLQGRQVLHVHRPVDVPAVVLDQVGSRIPERVEVARAPVNQYHLLQVTPDIALGVGQVEQSDRVQRLVDVSCQMNHVSSEEGPFGRVTVHLLREGFGGGGHDLQGTNCVFGVVDDGDDSIVDIGTVFEVPGVEEVHVVLLTLDVVGPGGGLDEGAAAVVAELVDGGDQVSEVDRGVGVELVHPDFCDGCGEHVTYIPPAGGQREEQSKQIFHHHQQL